MTFGSRKEESRERLTRFLNYLLWFIYGCFVFIWFKDSFSSFRKFPVSPLIPIVLFVAVFFVKLLIQKNQKRYVKRPRLKANRIFITIVILLLMAAAFRVPFLVHNYGLYTSDHAVSALMAKHISEGKLPPVYYYGQLYLGSFSEHVFALFFLVFGYSVFLVKLLTLMFYLCFIAVSFLLLKEIFSFAFAVFVSLFYCLPIGHLVTVSFYNTAPFSLTLLFGALILYLTYLVSHKARPALLPVLGFLMGLSFWTHQISVAFILTSSIFLAWKFRLQIKKYATLFVFAVLGSLPFWIHEMLEGFSLVRFLVPGEGKILIGARIQRAITFIRGLFFLRETPLDVVFLVLVFLGFVALTFLSFRKRTLVPQSLFSVFFFLFLALYLASDFSDKDVIRYLYPVYFCLPVLVFSVFSFLRSKVIYPVILLLFVSLFSFGNFSEQIRELRMTRGTARQLKEVIAVMEKTGKRYWRGEYWSAYLITALSKENIIVDSWTQNRYFPYRLEYFNRGENNNFLFLRGRGSYEARAAQRLVQLLDTLAIGYRSREIGDSLLIYDVESTVFPPVFDLNSSVPPHPPDLELTGIRNSDGYLYLTFNNKRPVKGQHLRAHVEIPDFSSAFLAFAWSTEKIEVKLPFPDEESFKIKYSFDFRGLKIPSTKKEIFYSRPEDSAKRREDIVHLSGVCPVVDREGKILRICEKEVKFEVNKKLHENSRIHLYLHSPFQFNHPYWYGDHSQKLRVTVNGVFLKEYEMEDGANRMDVSLRGTRLKEGSNIFTLSFKYHMPFDFFLRGKTAALLDGIEID